MIKVGCSYCSRTKPKKTIHKYHKTDEWGKWLICVECGKTMTWFPTRKENNGNNLHTNKKSRR